jgi:ribosomal protein S18 acetylase RimI-like enzyme
VTGGRDFRALAEDRDHQRHLPDLLPWVHEAGNPYFDWLLGDPGTARAAIEVWMRRSSSEIALERVVALFEDGRAVGGFVGLAGADLARCAKADSLVALKAVGREGRAELLRRAKAVAELRLPVDDDEWFLSKLGVLEPYRRGGRGRALLHEFLHRGEAQGFTRFRLDVWEQDEHTVRLYESAGFQTADATHSEELGRKLLAMRR